ncbi:MAG: glycosyl transferase, partial [Candidatus Omnitrophota bacterium]
NYDDENCIISASVEAPVTQCVRVIPGSHYLYSIVARSAKKKVRARKHIKWLDKDGKFIATDMQVFYCSQTWVAETMEVVAPSNAAEAIVYVSGHSSIPVEFKGCSLKERIV